jgi:predicted aspartyl protease
MARLTIHSWYQQVFDNSTVPQSPVLPVQIAGPEADDWIDVPAALVDTGADATMIPDAFLSQIQAAEWDQARLRSHWGEFRLVYRYEIDMRIGGRTFAGVLVVADDVGDEIILGRDLLNQLRFLYDGPARQFILVE